MASPQDTRPADHRQRRIDHLKMMNYSMTVDEASVTCTVKTAGLTYSDFDGKCALPKPWQLMKLLESARFYGHHWPLDESGRTFRDYAELTSDRLTFLVTSVMDIDMNLYNIKIPKSPLDVRVQGGYIGNTSLSSIATALTQDGHVLLSNVNQIVSVDKSTRRPFPLPEWWTSKYSNSSKEHASLKLSRFQKPDNLTPFRSHVVRSDQDGNGHTNWSCYVRYAMDAAYHFSKTGVLSEFPEIDKRLLKRMELLFSGESFDGDVLDVYVWPNSAQPDSVCVHIYKEQNLLFQSMFFYYENSQ